MSQRWIRALLALLAFLLLLVALLIGILIGSSGDDDDDGEAGEPSTTTSTTAPTTTTTTTTTAAPTTTTTTTTTTLPPPPLADVPSGEIAGFPIGSPMADVLTALTATYGPPDGDSGWTTFCELDGSSNSDRRYSWGALSIQFNRAAGPEILSSWTWPPGSADPTPGEVRFHGGLAATGTIGDASTASATAVVYMDIFDLTLVHDDFSWFYFSRGPGFDDGTVGPYADGPIDLLGWGLQFCE